MANEKTTQDRQQQPPYPLRMPDELRKALEVAAQINERSLNGEIVSRLRQSVGRSNRRKNSDRGAVK